MSLALLMLAACATRPPSASVESVPDDAERAFAAWKMDFYPRLLAEGFAPDFARDFLASLHPLPQVTRQDAAQAEFVSPIWTYIHKRVSPQSVRVARQKWQEHAALLRDIEAKYGIAPQYLLAIWGMETNYGAFMGKVNVGDALATLAMQGRRRAFAEEQLLDLAFLLRDGVLTPQQLQGSWAGALGHMQFMPSSYRRYAQDGDGDGRRDLFNPVDALVSSAYYLSEKGWQRGQTWGQEASLENLHALPYLDEWHPLTFWAARGVRGVNGAALPQERVEARLYVPAGIDGPVFLLYSNFKVIKRYNPADSYALAVGLLADAIADQAPVRAAWPENEGALRRDEVRAAQAALKQGGYAAGKVDGIIGTATRRAWRAWQRDHALPADGFMRRAELQQLLHEAHSTGGVYE